MTKMTQFSELKDGDTFDFISDDWHFNSFFERCVKTGTRSYRSLNSGIKMTVGTIKCRVYHVINGDGA